MAHFIQGCAYGNSLLAVEDNRTGFSLGGRCHDGADGLALGEDRAVQIRSRTDGGRGSIVAQIVIARSTTACFGLNKIRCDTFNLETHVSSVKADDVVWLCGSEVHQSFRIFYSVSGGQSFLGADFVERDENGGTTSLEM